MFLIMVLLKAELAKIEMEGLKFAATASLSKLKLVLLPQVYCSKLGLVFKKKFQWDFQFSPCKQFSWASFSWCLARFTAAFSKEDILVF